MASDACLLWFALQVVSSRKYLLAVALCVSVVLASNSTESETKSGDKKNVKRCTQCSTTTTYTRTYDNNHHSDRYLYKYNDGTVVQRLSYHPGLESHSRNVYHDGIFLKHFFFLFL